MKLIKKLFLQILTVVIIILLTQHAVISISSNFNPLRPPDTNSPRATMSGFMNNMNQAYTLIMEAEEQSKKDGGLWHSQAVREKADEANLALKRATMALNLVDISPVTVEAFGTQSALMLKEILDRLELPRPSMIPSQEDVFSKSLTRWEVPKTEITIQLVEKGFDKDEFLFSPETLKRIRKYYQLIKKYPYNESNYWKKSPKFYEFYISTPGHLLPPKWNTWLPRGKNIILFYGQTLWQWFSLAIVTLIIFFTVFFAYKLIFKISHKEKITDPRKKSWLGLFIPIFTYCLITFWKYIIYWSINITGQLLENLLTLSTVLRGLVLAWFAFMVFNSISSTIIFRMAEQNRDLKTVTIHYGFRLLGAATALIVLYITCNEIGITAGTIIASFGISSVAIGLGVKPYIENIVGGLTLLLTDIIKVGDFCELGGVTGTVENISLRSTLIRTPERDLISVRNTVVSTLQIVNHSKRDNYYFDKTLSLSYDSVHEDLEEIMEKLRNVLAQDPKLSEESVGISSLSHEIVHIDIFAYIPTRDLAESLLIQEEILLKINKILETSGVKVMAFSNR
jgi:MscS family membrane protein